MVIETPVDTHKRTHRRAKPLDPQELLAQLDAGDLRLLQWLLRYPFQRAEDLALALASSHATVYRHLSVLHTMGLIEYVMPPALGANTCRLYHLSNVGLHVLAIQEQTDPLEMARTCSTDERGLLRLLPRLSSLVTLQQCMNGLVAYAPEALAHLGRRSEVRWHWVRGYAHHFLYREKLMRCTADAALLLRFRTMTEDGMSSQEQWYNLFVLLDAEIANDTWLKQRLGRLLCYRESAERWPVYQHFPPVLVLVSTPHRMELWQRCAMEAATVLHVSPLTGAVVCVPENSPSAPVNLWRCAWKSLATNVPCTLRRLLHPLPIEALPPGLWDHTLTDRKGAEATSVRETVPPSSSTRKRTRIVVGNYMKRATNTKGEHTGNDRDEREIIALLGLSLGHRHFALLHLLFTHPLLALHEMGALLEREDSSIERYLGLLSSQDCIERIASDVGQRWRLSERGLHLIAATQHISIQRIATVEESDGETYLVQRGVDVLLRHLEHTAGIYGFFASLSQAASQERLQGREHRLLWWETGAACERRYRDHERWHNLRPDAGAEYQAGERQVRFWLEWDRATMGTRDLVAKFRTYAHYVTSREWFKEKEVLPHLLVIAPDKEQEMRIAHVAAAFLANTRGLVVRTTTSTRLTVRGPLAAIWYQVPWDNEMQEMVPRSRFFSESHPL